MKNNVRLLALNVLEKIFVEQAYSNIAINHALKESTLSLIDKSLLTELVYGTVQYRLTLEYIMKDKLKGRVKGWVKRLLMMSIYQMFYLDKIPSHAIINEAVNIAKIKGGHKTAGMVNAILRTIQREGQPDYRLIKNDIKRISYMYSLPEWLAQRWIKQYGYQETQKLAQASLTRPQQTIRVNTYLTDVDHVISELKKLNYKIQRSEYIAECLLIKGQPIIHQKIFKDGWVSLQDESSMLVANIIDPQPNDVVLDVCAAPGGKSMHIAEKLNNTGQVIACDIHEHKLNLIQENISRLNLTNMITKQYDAVTTSTNFNQQQFDVVLVDAPCSGLGVLRRKPEIKYSRSLEDIYTLSRLQLDILSSASKVVKIGGSLIYSTCTIDDEENTQVIAQFLQQYPNFKRQTLPVNYQKLINKDGDIQLMPHIHQMDGFYIAKLTRMF